MKKLVSAITLAIIVAFSSTCVWAGPWGGRFYGMGPAISNLTPEQQSKILALQQAHHEKVTPIQEELFKKKIELRTLWTSQNPDQAKINALQKEIFELIDQLQQEATQLRSEILKVIESTPAK